MNEKMFIDRIIKFRTRLGERILGEWRPLDAEYSWSKEPTSFADRLQGEYKSIGEGKVWGQAWDSAWFHLTAQTPQEWDGRKIVAQLDFTGEGLVLNAAGAPIQGISSGSVFDKDFSRDVVHLYDACRGGKGIELWVQAVGNDLFGVSQEEDPASDRPQRYGSFECRVNRMRLCLFDKELWHLWLDVNVLNGLLRRLPQQSVRRARLIRCLNEAIDAFQDDAKNAAASRHILMRELSTPAAASDLAVRAVGHAHIDTAWLWPVSETVRKCARTFASQVKLLEKYPHYIFGASQPQHYLFVKQTWPELYDKIKSLVQQGRWEPQGGMWVEADCNLISGESMVRQILHGKNFFMEEFGVDVKNLWLPDVFGYAASMPQIMKKSGLDFFLTQKLSWNQINEFPHHTFKWRGIDGSEVIVHFPPENTYNSMLHPDTLIPGRDSFREKGFIDEFISLFGVGDGGGGPKEENIEFGLRMADLEGAPRVKFGSAQQFFDGLRQYKDSLATWVGELYLELHRGTLTTQAQVKKKNRMLENALREVEFLFSCLSLDRYPAAHLDAIWKKVLLNQFHDILPGSSINQAYRTTHAEHEQALTECRQLSSNAVDLLFKQDAESLVMINLLSFPFSGAVELPDEWEGGLQSNSGDPAPMQQEDSRMVVFVELPPLSFTTFQKRSLIKSVEFDRSDLRLENDLVRYVFDSRGQLLEAFDKEQEKAILASGAPGNVLSLYDDRPLKWDAWDVDLFYEKSLLETLKAHFAERCTGGCVRQGLAFRYAFGDSTLEQKIYLAQNSKRLDFRTRVNWRERHRMLRVSFSVNVRSEQASFDIPYGYVKRNTHRNTSWDAAKFEVAGQRYADLSDNDYGVALLNDCKYGYKVFENVLDLNLLRSPTYPDPDADQGEHEFTYSLLPHRGDLIRSDVIRQASMLNRPPGIFPGYQHNNQQPPISVLGDGISLEVIKKAEKADCLILRIIETKGVHARGTLRFTRTPKEITATNLMERDELKKITPGRDVALTLKPFEIFTLKATLA